MRVCHRGIVGVALLLPLACSSGPGTQAGPTATQLGLAVQPGAAAQSGAPLNPQPVVVLQDAQGNPVALRNKVILVDLAAPGGTLTGTLQAKTDEQGRAAFTDLGIVGLAGPRQLRFDATGLRSVTSASIQLGAGSATTLAPVGGNLQTAVAGSPVAVAPSVRVTDAAGNPITGAAVSFAPSAGSSVVGGNAVTGADGVAAPQSWTLATAIGLNTLTVTTAAIPGASLFFTATGTVGPPALLSASAGEGQSATVGGPTAIAPAVLLTDAVGHPLSGVAVSFAVATGGGTVSGATPLTDASGIATLGSWILGLPPGPNTLTVTRAGVPPLTLHATGVDFPVLALSGGAGSTCALNPAGKAYCWGSNSSGQVGNGNTVDVRVPTAVNGGLTFAAISDGAGHACGLLANGDGYCWGANDVGQLGDGTLVQRTIPVPVSGGNKFSAIRTGAGFTCGLRLDNAVYCWGVGTGGQLGDGTLISKPVPTAVAGAHSFTALSAGASHACAIDQAGAAWCWGGNGSGRLGDGSTTTRSSPAAVTGGLVFNAIAAGGAYTCGIASGTGYCWGSGASGLLGNGTTSDQLSPTAVSPTPGGVLLTSISARSGHTCATTTVQTIVCWGSNAFGQLGDGTNLTRLVATAVSGGLTWDQVAVGAEHSCGRATTGGVYCWGRNDLGAVGDGTQIHRNRPVGAVKP